MRYNNIGILWLAQQSPIIGNIAQDAANVLNVGPALSQYLALSTRYGSMCRAGLRRGGILLSYPNTCQKGSQMQPPHSEGIGVLYPHAIESNFNLNLTSSTINTSLLGLLNLFKQTI